MFECVINISEGRRFDVLDSLSRAAGASLRDRHADEVHHRSVFTLIHDPGPLRRDAHAIITEAMDRLDLTSHSGVHPRFGVVDVVPYVALEASRAEEAVALRDATATWMADTFNVPIFLYGPLSDGSQRSLPEVRRHAFGALAPDVGPRLPDPRRGASALGARGVLVAWNLWVRGISLDEGQRVAASIRRPGVRALAFQVATFVQISCNLIEPTLIGPSQVYDLVEHELVEGVIDHAELVGLAPRAMLEAQDPSRWAQLGLSVATTIEARLR